MRRYNLGAHIKTDLKAYLGWSPKYRKRVLTRAGCSTFERGAKADCFGVAENPIFEFV